MDDLRRRIAERLGHFLKEQLSALDDPAGAPIFPSWIDQAARLVAEQLRFRQSITGRELHSRLRGLRFESEAQAWETLPDWTSDANAALALPGPNIVVRRQIVGPNWCAAVLLSVSGDSVTWKIVPETYAEADTPALAICRAWLAWKDTQSEANR